VRHVHLKTVLIHRRGSLLQRLHAADARIAHGFPMTAVLAEFRALRHTILPLYEESGATDPRHRVATRRARAMAGIDERTTVECA
jgi:hypothetical protein